MQNWLLFAILVKSVWTGIISSSKENGQNVVPTYKAANFGQMIAEVNPDTVIVTTIVTTIDATHQDYIIRAMDLGCDVISETPMTTDRKQSQSYI